MTVVIAALALVALGVMLRLPAKGVAGMLAALWLGVVLGHAVLPEGHPVRVSLGGSLGDWLAVGVLVAAGFGYGEMLGYLRRRAVAVREAASEAASAVGRRPGFSAAELERYARHIVLREVGGPGQKALRAARVLVVGAGGLGSPALLYLAAAGVGSIGVIDDDAVSNSNLQRQVIHTDARIGMAKVRSARSAMLALNPAITVETYERRLNAAEAPRLFAEYDLILDGSDNFDTRYLVNSAAVGAGKPLIAAAIAQWEGQISLYDPARGGPCYACVFPIRPAPGLAPSCAEAGVIAPLPGVLGAMMALEAVKLITGAGVVLRGEMVIFDGLWGETRKIKLAARADCPVCKGRGAEV